MTVMSSTYHALVMCFATFPIAAQIDWQQVANTNAPAPLCGSSWDSDRDVLVTYGGTINGIAQFQTKEWNGTSWNTATTVASPVPCSRVAMAYDEARGETVLFGGGDIGQFLSSTWTYDGTNWTLRSPATVPAGRSGAAMVYDRSRQVIVMFGGFRANGQDFNETWEWDGTNWSLRSVLLAPSARGAHRMVYDTANSRVLMCGGYSTPQQTTLADCWAFNGNTWSLMASLPGTRCDQAMVYDPTRRRVMLFGGLRIQGGQLTDLGDTLEFDGNWTARTPPTPVPTAGSGGACAFDTLTNRMLLAGGTGTGTGISQQTWLCGPVQPASASEFGVGCFVTNGIRLEPRTMPYAGLPFEQAIVAASPAAAIGLVVFGTSDALWGSVSLPFDMSVIGAPSCSLLVSLDVSSTVLLTGGAGTTTWQIPNLSALAGLTFFTQGAALDPTSPLPFQVDMTAALQLVLGNP